MVKYRSSSTVRPPEWDKTSSPTKIYHHVNIVEVPATDDNPVMYTYDVEEYETKEYIDMQDKRIAKLQATCEMHEACLLEMSEIVYA